MASTIKIKNSSTAGAIPTSSDLVQGELAVNVTDKTIFTENASGTVVELGKNYTGFKNRIINGAMMIDQRNAGAAVTLNGNELFPVDRFACGDVTDGSFTAQQVSDAPTGFVNSLKCTITAADTSLTTTQTAYCRHTIEGLNVADFAWGTANASPITLSFWVKSSLTGTFGGALRNSGATRSYPYTYTINAANTWEQKTITIAGDTSGTWLTTNGEGVNVQFSLGAGPDRVGTAGAWNSNNNVGATGQVQVIGTNGATWQITGVQLEKGSTATSFDYRPYGTELALCQRYYQKQLGVFVGFARIYATGAGATIGQTLLFPTPMRAAPTGAIIGTWAAINTAAPGFSSYIYADSAFISGSSNAAGDTVIYANANTYGYSLNAEL